ncbi:hypothetical protein ABTL43_19630, partial [Acinetobacter baumannii]
INTGVAKIADTDKLAHPTRSMNPTWSPDGKWIAYVQIQQNQFKAVKVFNVETAQKIQITNALSDAIDPEWDESGKYLYFLSSTDYG